MIKVAHLITRLTLGGAQETVYYYYKNHDKNKFQFYFLAGMDESYLGQNYIESLEKDDKFINIKNLQNNINLFKDIKSFFEIYTFLKSNKIQILHTHSSKAGIIGRFAGKFARVPVIIHTVHGWSFHENLKESKFKTYRFLERLAAKFTDKFIVVTSKDAEKGVMEGIALKNKYVLIRSGIDIEYFEKYNKENAKHLKKAYKNKKIVGTVCRLTEQKNPLDFLKVAKMLTRKRNDIHFIIVGDGELREKVEKYIKTNNIENHVTLFGNREDVREFYHIMDVFVLTSLWEGLPRVLPEAMVCGVPVIANDVGGIGEILKDGYNGYTIKAHDIGNAAVKIEKLIDEIATKYRVVSYALTTVKPEFSAKTMVDKTEALYMELFERKNVKVLSKECKNGEEK